MKTNILHISLIVLSAGLLMVGCGGSGKQQSSDADTNATQEVSQSSDSQETVAYTDKMLIGKWQNIFNTENAQVNVTHTFGKNGKCMIYMTASEKDTGEDGTVINTDIVFRMFGHYEVNGQELTVAMNLNSSQIAIRNGLITTPDGATYSLTDYARMAGESPQGMVNAIKEKFRKSILEPYTQNNGSITTTITSLTKNELQLSSGQKYTRVS